MIQIEREEDSEDMLFFFALFGCQSTPLKIDTDTDADTDADTNVVIDTGMETDTGIPDSGDVSNTHTGDLDTPEALSGLCDGYDILHIDGKITLHGVTDAQLSELWCLRSVSGSISIANSPELTSLSPLSQLTDFQKYFLLFDNDALTDLVGLGGITPTSVQIYDSDNLVSLRGLNPDISELNRFTLSNNTSLSDLSLFPALTHISSLKIGTRHGGGQFY